MPWDKKDKEKSSVVYYESRNPEHFKSEYSDLEKNQNKMKIFKTKENKGLMCTWGRGRHLV